MCGKGFTPRKRAFGSSKAISHACGYLHYHLDATGNVQFLLAGESHLGLEKYTYDAFGKPTIMGWNGDGAPRPVSNYGNRFMFTGREFLYTLGLYDYRHRLYHPGLGRFIQTDPIGFEGDPLNLYRYCSGNPVGHSDPTGLNPLPYHMTHLGGTDFGAHANNSQAGVTPMGVVQKNADAKDSQSLDPKLKHFDIPGAIDRLDEQTEQYAKRHPKYPNGQAVVDGLRRALREGKIQPGERSDFIKNNPVATSKGVIMVDPYAKVNPSDFPSVLAHDGQHFVDKVYENDKGFMRERRAYDVEYGFGELTGSTRPRVTNDEIRGFLNIPR